MLRLTRRSRLTALLKAYTKLSVMSLVQAGMEQRCMRALTLVVPAVIVRVLAPHAPM